MNNSYPPEGPVPRNTFLEVFNDILSNISRDDIPKDESGGWESWLRDQYADGLLLKQSEEAPYLQGFKIMRDYDVWGNGGALGILIEAEDSVEESSLIVLLCRTESESSSCFGTRLNNTTKSLREILDRGIPSRFTNSSQHLSENLVIFLVAPTHDANDRNKSMAWFFIRQPGIYLMWKPIWLGCPED